MIFHFRKGESLLEVLLALSVFSLASISTISAVNFSLYTAQADLENTQARSEIDAQAEVLRFIHDNYANYKNRGSNVNLYSGIWHAITDLAKANTGSTAPDYTICTAAYEGEDTIDKHNAFVVNTRALTSSSIDSAAVLSSHLTTEDYDGLNPLFTRASTYPHLIFANTDSGLTDEDSVGSATLGEYTSYKTVASAEGIWVYGVPSEEKIGDEPTYYDFYIGTCWYAQGKTSPNSINTTIRLYNPDAEDIQVTSKVAVALNFVYRDEAGNWVNYPVTTTGKVNEYNEITIDVADTPAIKNSSGNIFAGWTVVEDEALNSINSKCSIDYNSVIVNGNSYNFCDSGYTSVKLSGGMKGEYCKNINDLDEFHPECNKTQITYSLAGASTMEIVTLLMVERPPMDIAVILDGSGSMPEEISGVKAGLNALSSYVLGSTEGRISLTFLRQSPGSADGSNYYSLCDLGYRGLTGTCGGASETSASDSYFINDLVSKINVNTSNDNKYNLAYSSSSPEWLSYNSIMEQLINLSTSTADHEPGYNKMIILVTDTVSEDSEAIPSFKGVYGAYCGAYNNCNTANDIQNLLADKAEAINARIYVIQSYADEPHTNLGTDGYYMATKTAVNSSWGTMTSDSGGAIIDAQSALGEYKNEAFAGSTYPSEFSYSYVTGKLSIKSYYRNGSVYSDKTYGN